MKPHQTEIRRDYTRPFKLDEAKLRKIVNIVETVAAGLQSPSWRFQIWKSDSSVYTFDTIDAVLADDNATHRRIDRLEIVFESLPEAVHIRIEISRTNADAPAKDRPKQNITVRHPERDRCFVVADDLDAQLRRMFTRDFSMLTGRAPDRLLALSFALIPSIWVFSGVRLLPPAILLETSELTTDAKIDLLLEHFRARSTAENQFGYAPIAMLASMAIMILWLEIKPISRLASMFYQPSFYWGDQIAVEDRRDKLRSNVFWAILVASIVGIISSAIYARL